MTPQQKYYLKHREELLIRMRENSKKYYELHKEEIKAKYTPTGRPRGRPRKTDIPI